MTTLPNSELGLFQEEPSQVMHHLMNLLEINDAEMADRLGIARQSVHALRTGRSRASGDRLRQIANALGVPAPLMMGTAAEAIRTVLDRMESEGDDDGPGGNVTPLRSASVGGAEKRVWQSPLDDFLPVAA